MIYSKTNPIGLDATIAKIQKELYDQLNVTWSIDLEAYERCYILENEGKKTINRFVSKKEYQLISVAEKSKFFFLQRAKATKEDMLNWKTDLELIFIVDLSKVKPQVTHRADSEVQNDVELILNQFDNVWLKTLDFGYDKALQGISYEQQNDMQPYHVFKFNLEVEYQMNDTCCC